MTALLVGHDGGVVARGYSEFPQHYPRPGWVEHDVDEIWQALQSAVASALAVAGDSLPVAVGVANQRETCLFWERGSGRPLHRAIVWQCRRTAAICEELRQQGLEPQIAARTGLRLDPYFSGTKALWLRRSQPGLASRIDAGEVAFGTLDSWLACKLSGGALHETDFSNACRTLAFDIHRLDWDEGLLDLFGLSRKVMAGVGPSSRVYGLTRDAAPLPDGLPIACLAGDQQAALFGQACFRPGLTKATYGTGCFVLSPTGGRPAVSRTGLLTTLTASAGLRPAYAIEGSIFVAGAALQWCRDNLGLVKDAAEAEATALSVRDSGGVVFVPAFAGLGSPHWGPDVRGALYGLTRGTRPAHIVRAALDAMVYQAQDVLTVLAVESGQTLGELRVDGGAAANDALMQLQADLAGVPVSRPASVESTALGAAYLAGLATGFWHDDAEIEALRREERRFLPSPRDEMSLQGYARWRAAVQGLLQTHIEPVSGYEDAN